MNCGKSTKKNYKPKALQSRLFDLLVGVSCKSALDHGGCFPELSATFVPPIQNKNLHLSFVIYAGGVHAKIHGTILNPQTIALALKRNCSGTSCAPARAFAASWAKPLLGSKALHMTYVAWIMGKIFRISEDMIIQNSKWQNRFRMVSVHNVNIYICIYTQVGMTSCSMAI